MKKYLFLLMAFCYVLSFGQNSKVIFAMSKPVQDESFDEEQANIFTYTGDSVTAAQAITLLLKENIDVSKVGGRGKQSTLITVSFTKDGLLYNVAADGENRDFNSAALAVLKDYVGSQTKIFSGKSNAIKLQIPLSFVP